mgnify:CR=1 FL=1
MWLLCKSMLHFMNAFPRIGNAETRRGDHNNTVPESERTAVVVVAAVAVAVVVVGAARSWSPT